MHFSTLILGLVAAVSAIDIRGHVGDSCRGSYRACKGASPRFCCRFSSSSSSGRASVAIVAIPTSWRIKARSWTGGACRHVGTELASNGRSHFCLPYTTRGDRTGSHYWFPGRKRAAEDECEGTLEPDTFGLIEDGTEYNITGLAEEKIQEMEEIAKAGGGADAMPAEFQALRR